MRSVEYFPHVLAGVTRCEIETTRAHLGLALANALPAILGLAREYHPDRQIELCLSFTIPGQHRWETTGRVGELNTLVRAMVETVPAAISSLAPTSPIRATLRARLGPQVPFWRRLFRRGSSNGT